MSPQPFLTLSEIGCTDHFAAFGSLDVDRTDLLSFLIDRAGRSEKLFVILTKS